MRAGSVFIPGGFPELTYVSRGEKFFEEKIDDYLDEKHRILSISGPTKTGKTVLVKKMLRGEDEIWISGGTIASEDDLWINISDSLGLYTGVEDGSMDSEAEERNKKGGVSIKIAKGELGSTSRVASQNSRKLTRSRSPKAAAREALRGGLHPLVIDDFHYIEEDVQMAIIRSLKDLVFDGLPVIVIAVPHRAYDVVRVEKEMTGRVEQLNIGFWSEAELAEIPRTGFSILNLEDEGQEITRRLSRESFSSPHLIQDFCLNICKEQGYRKRPEEVEKLKSPSEDEWRSFFFNRASDNASKTAFELLARGPRQRSDRKIRKLKGGSSTDIYGALLLAVAATGPGLQITYETLRASLRNVLDSELPQKQQVSRVLEQMTKIAQKSIEGEPVVDYDAKLATLHISDPYFAYYLRWCANPNMSSLAEQEVHISNVAPSQ